MGKHNKSAEVEDRSKRFIAKMNRKWERKYKLMKTRLDELEDM